MKTETEIAEEKIKAVLLAEDREKYIWKKYCQEHKASCQRFLEFLEDLENNNMEGKTDGNESKEIKKILDKITDLQNAIKRYDEAGI